MQVQALNEKKTECKYNDDDYDKNDNNAVQLLCYACTLWYIFTIINHYVFFKSKWKWIHNLNNVPFS